MTAPDTPAVSEPTWPADRKLMAALTAEQHWKFTEWMRELDAAHVKRGSPYGAGSLWKLTGAECWWGFFEEGLSPKDALIEDEESWSE